MAMLALYKSAAEHILAEMSLLGADCPSLEESRKARVRDFVENIKGCEKDPSDSTAVLLELAKDSEAFSINVRKKMGAAVSAYMNTSSISSDSLSKAHEGNLQTNNFLHEYYPDGHWKNV